MAEGILSVSFWTKSFVETYQQFKGYLTSYLPNVVAGLAVLVLGFFLAKFARFLGQKIGMLIFRLFFTIDKKLRLKSAIEKFSKALGFIFYWIVLVYFVFFSLKILNIPGVSTWLAQMVHFIPQMISLLCIAIVGFLLGTFAKESIYDHSDKKTQKDPHILAHGVKYGIFALFTLWGLGQIGINISIITNFIGIILAAILSAGALGFGLGSGSHVSNIIASYNIRKSIKIGESITIGGQSGVVVDITKTTVFIESADGTVMIPAKITNETVIVKNTK
jgi:small-conductance mechanosensitive channel